MKKYVIILVLCVGCLGIGSVVYFYFRSPAMKDYDSIPLSGWIEHRGENNDIATTNDIDFLVQKLGFVDEGVSTEKIEICMSYLGYVYEPADSAYDRLQKLDLSYDDLYRYYELSIHGNNRLRSILLACLLCRQDPKRFSNDVKKLLIKTKNTNEKVLIFQGAIEAFMPSMVLKGPPAKKDDAFYATLFAEGRKFFNELDPSLDEIYDGTYDGTNIVVQEINNVVVPLSKQLSHGKIVYYDALYFRLFLKNEYDEYTATKKRK